MILKWKLFGTFTLEYGEITLTEHDIRSKKLIQLLACLLLNRKEPLTQAQLIDIFCDPDAKGPADTLKNLIYRLRNALKPLGDQDFICTFSGGYQWNPKIEVESDYDHFVSLVNQAGKMRSGEPLKKICREALSCYRDDFTNRLVRETWFAALAHDCKKARIDMVKMLCQAEEMDGKWSAVEKTCQDALDFDAFDEDVHCWMIRSLCQQNRYEAAIHHYELARKMIFEATGVSHQPKLHQAYVDTISNIGQYIRNLGTVLIEAAEAEKPKGAYLCGYETFRQIYQVEARKSVRANLPEGTSEHILLLSVLQTHDFDVQEVDAAEMEEIMGVLCRTIQSSLRMGDVYAQCSPSQYIVLLGACTLVNADMVANRIRKAFSNNLQRRPFQLSYELDSLKTYDLQQQMQNDELL